MTYLQRIAGLIRSEVPADLVPEDSDSLFLLYAVLARAKGASVTPEDVHDAWVAWCDLRGVQHSSAVPFADLDEETQSEDEPFVAAIRTVARSLD